MKIYKAIPLPAMMAGLLVVAVPWLPDSATAASATELREWADKVMEQRGEMVQTARACGMADSEMSGQHSFYLAARKFAQTVQDSKLTFDADQKRAIGTAADVDAAFLRGVQRVAARGAPSAAACATLRAHWPGAEASARAFADRQNARSNQLREDDERGARAIDRVSKLKK